MYLYSQRASAGGMQQAHTQNFSVAAINSTSESDDDEFPFKNFAPTLAQCYAIVFAGFLLAKSEILSESDVRGVSAFASYVAMPAIICVSIADADLENLQWELLVGIALGKVVIFAGVAACGILLSKPRNEAVAGIYAMFCVQCNDLPVGNPLMSALYRYVRPHMMKYLFFVPAITLVLFSPITYLMAEINREKTAIKESAMSCECGTRAPPLGAKLYRFLKSGIIKSPVVVATVLGVCLNLIFKAQIPPALHHPIHVLAATIPGIALSILGFTISGKERFVISSGIVLAIAFVFIKIVLTPLILHSVVSGLAHDVSDSKELSDFALLYGIISPAAVVFRTAQDNGIQIAAMSAALILSSLSCFPLSYFIARLTIITPIEFKEFVPTIRNVLFYASCISLLCCAYTLGSFVRDRHWKKKAHLCVAYFLFCQVLVGSSSVIWYTRGQPTLVTEYLFIGGEFAGDVWIGVLLAAVMLQAKYPTLLKNYTFILICGSFGGILFVLNLGHSKMTWETVSSIATH